MSDLSFNSGSMPDFVAIGSASRVLDGEGEPLRTFGSVERPQALAEHSGEHLHRVLAEAPCNLDEFQDVNPPFSRLDLPHEEV